MLDIDLKYPYLCLLHENDFIFLYRGGLDANQTLRTHFSSAVSSALEDTDAASKNLLSSIDRESPNLTKAF